MHFTLPLRLSSKRLSRYKRPPSPPPTPPPVSDMSGRKADPVVIELDDTSDEDEEYGTPLSSSDLDLEVRLGAAEGAENDQRPFLCPDARSFEPFPNGLGIQHAAQPADPEQLCIDRVLEVFPDIDREHVRQLYRDRPLVMEGGLANSNPSEDLIVKVLDGGIYPKEADRRKELKRKRATSAASSDGETAVWEAADRERASTHYSEEA